MSEDTQITTAIPKVTDSDETAVTPKIAAEPAEAPAVEETRLNPKITDEIVDESSAVAETADLDATDAEEKTAVIEKPEAGEEKTAVIEKPAAAEKTSIPEKTPVKAPVAEKADVVEKTAVIDKTPAFVAPAAAAVAVDTTAVAEKTAATEVAAQAAAGPVRDRTGRVKATSSGTVRPARKARLRIAKVDPWSVMKTALMFSLAAAIILFVAVALLWSVIEASGALDTLQETMNSLLGNPDGTGTVQVNSIIDRWRVLGFTAIVSGINVILLTALATLAAFLYNLSSSVLGGLDITLAED